MIISTKPVSLKPAVTYLEYIQSSGTQWIDTGVSAPSGFRIVADIMFDKLVTTHQCIIGAHDQDPPYYRNFFSTTEVNTAWEIGCYDFTTFGAVQAATRYKIDFNNISGQIKCVVNGVDQNVPESVATNSARSERSLWLFNCNYPGVSWPMYGKLYGCQIYNEAGDMMRNFKPAKAPGGAVCLYDEVSKTYFQNAGSGRFTAGPEV